MKHSISRRDFLRTGLVASAGAAIASPLITRRAHGANDTVGIGILGMGWRGGDLAKSIQRHEKTQIVAVADPDKNNAAKAAQFEGAKAYADLRELLDDPRVDVVFVSTCNHWHCLASILAMQAGKDVYVEKPLSHTQWEGRQVVNAARKYNRVCQLGTQQRSDLGLQNAAKTFLHEEQQLGRILYVQANRLGVREPIGKRDTPLPIPEEVDYNLWLGPAADQPLYRDKFHYDWHWNFNTGNGEMGNWGTHILDDIRNVCYRDSVMLPKRILVAGGRAAWNDAGNTPNVHFAFFDTGSFPTILALSNMTASPTDKKDWSVPGARSFSGPGSGYVVACEGGYYLGQRGSGKAIDLDGKEIAKFPGADHMHMHVGNFFEAVRNRTPQSLNAEIEQGHASSGWCNLANIGFQVGRPYSRAEAESIAPDLEQWSAILGDMEKHLAAFGVSVEGPEMRMSPILHHNEQSERFVGNYADAANAFLKRQYREPFVVPEIILD